MESEAKNFIKGGAIMEVTLSVLIDFVVQSGLYAVGIVTAYYVSVRYC